MIVLYVGARGRGKTLTMVKDGFISYKNGYKILRNFNCKFGKFISNDDIINLDKHSNIYNAVLLVDEIQIFFDSRRSSKHQNVHFSNFVQQIRKRNVHIYCTTQYHNTVDLRLRQHLDFMAHPFYYEKYKVCEVTYKDLQSIETDLFSGVLKEPEEIKIVYNAVPIFDLYNTSELIA